MEKVPIWRKLLHWPLVFGRESLWNTMSALSIPLMISRGITTTGWSWSRDQANGMMNFLNIDT